MVKEQSRRDILADLLHGEPAEKIPPAAEALTQLIHQYTESVFIKSPRHAAPEPQGTRPLRPQLMKKTTHYLSINTTEALEEAKEEIRTLVSPGLKRMVSKSRIVDMALQYVLKELAEKGTESPLVEYIVSQKSRR